MSNIVQVNDIRVERWDSDGNAVDVTYSETEDRWEFVLRGRNRSAASLGKATEFIQKVPTEPKEKKVFEPMPAILATDFAIAGYKRVTVISIVQGYGSNLEYWVKDEQGNRSKERGYCLYEDTLENNRLIKAIRLNNDEQRRLREDSRNMVSRMTAFKLLPEGWDG